MRASLIAATAGAVMAMVLAGCSDLQGGNAQPTTGGGSPGTTETTRPTSTSTGGAPKVDVPLDAAKYLPQPCAVLSATALRGFNVSKPGEPDVDSQLAKTVGPRCSWDTDDKPVPKLFDVGFVTGNKNGLSDTYRGGKEAFPGYFEPTEVSGYPAVFNDLTDQRPDGTCNITVGISETLAFRSSFTAGSDDGAKSCDLVKRVAAAVITTLKGA